MRNLHENILNSFLWILPSSDASYAYKINRNTLRCLKVHEGNQYFVKLDIHKYFESITLSKVSYKISAFIQNQYLARFNKITFFSMMKNENTQNAIEIIRRLFCNYKLPIGFVTSPKISDFYLYDLDEEMTAINGIKYTRYADDILISSNNKEKLNEAVSHLINLLETEELELNNKKTRYGYIRNSGDSFKFLGINIVKRDKCYEYTISHKYLDETCKLIVDSIKSKYNGSNEALLGRINYIKSISIKSFEKLRKLTKLKLNQQGLSVPSWLNFHFR